MGQVRAGRVREQHMRYSHPDRTEPDVMGVAKWGSDDQAA